MSANVILAVAAALVGSLALALMAGAFISAATRKTWWEETKEDIDRLPGKD